MDTINKTIALKNTSEKIRTWLTFLILPMVICILVIFLVIFLFRAKSLPEEDSYLAEILNKRLGNYRNTDIEELNLLKEKGKKVKEGDNLTTNVYESFAITAVTAVTAR